MTTRRTREQWAALVAAFESTKQHPELFVGDRDALDTSQDCPGLGA